MEEHIFYVWRDINLSSYGLEKEVDRVPSNLPLDTDFDSSTSINLTLLWIVITGVVFICILCGNTLTIITIRCCRRLRSMVSNTFILSLAISDFIVGLTLPYHMSFYLSASSSMGRSLSLCMIRFFLIIFACSVSTLTLISIAIDRYIAIMYALHYRRFMTRRLAYGVIAFNWIFGAFVASIPFYWNNFETAHQCEFYEILPRWYMAGIILPAFLLIWSVMLLIYLRIMREASKQAQQLRSSIISQGPPNIHLKHDWKSVQIIIIIMGTFSLCWLPYYVIACFQIFHVCEIRPIIYKLALTLAMTNSGLNSIIYCWKNRSFRKAYSRLLQCKSPNHHAFDMEHSHHHHSIHTPHLTKQLSTNSITAIKVMTQPDQMEASPAKCEQSSGKVGHTSLPAAETVNAISLDKNDNQIISIDDDTIAACKTAECDPCLIYKSYLSGVAQP